jgi:hypothetical protein
MSAIVMRACTVEKRRQATVAPLGEDVRAAGSGQAVL